MPPIPPITTKFFAFTTEYIIKHIIFRLSEMTRDFCTRTAKKLRTFGCEKKLARRLAQFCYIEMTLVCGMFGFFDIFGNGLAPIRSSPAATTGTGAIFAGARAGTVSPAPALLRN